MSRLPVTVLIQGGIASGKSTISKLLVAAGCVLVFAARPLLVAGLALRPDDPRLGAPDDPAPRQGLRAPGRLHRHLPRHLRRPTQQHPARTLRRCLPLPSVQPSPWIFERDGSCLDRRRRFVVRVNGAGVGRRRRKKRRRSAVMPSDTVWLRSQGCYSIAPSLCS